MTSKSNADYVPNLSSLAQQKYDLIIAVGFLMAEAIDKVAKKFPRPKFAIIDFSQAGMKSKPKNVHGPAVQGAGGGLPRGLHRRALRQGQGRRRRSCRPSAARRSRRSTHYIAGYQAGAKAANPGIKTLNGYSQDFVDQAKCKEIALDQIAEGSQVVFQVAGQCGLGALDAAKEKRRPGASASTPTRATSAPRS